MEDSSKLSYSKLSYEKSSVVPLDPRTKIFLAITVSTIMVSGGTEGIMNIVRPCLAAFPILLLLLSKKWTMAVKFTVTYFILFTLEIVLLPLLRGNLNFLVGAMIGIYTHMLPGFVMGYYLISTTKVSEFVASMEKIHIPQSIVIPISVVFRFFPTLKEEYAAICDAMKMRQITMLKSPIKMLEYRIVPLMIEASKIGEELSAAALTRGLGAPVKRTNICELGFGILDMVLIVLSIFCWIGFITY